MFQLIGLTLCINWNTVITVHNWLQYLSGGIHIALSAAQHCGEWEKCSKWKFLPHEEFYNKYNEEVLKDYKIPTEEEVEEFENWEEEARREEEEQRRRKNKGPTPEPYLPFNDQDLYGSE